jgi:hypothetical protein
MPFYNYTQQTALQAYNSLQRYGKHFNAIEKNNYKCNNLQPLYCFVLLKYHFPFCTCVAQIYIKLFFYPDVSNSNCITSWSLQNGENQKKKLNSMICVRVRTIPTERPQLVGEVIANFCG